MLITIDTHRDVSSLSSCTCIKLPGPSSNIVPSALEMLGFRNNSVSLTYPALFIFEPQIEYEIS